jgi:PadR family transcriptional regulator PadR
MSDEIDDNTTDDEESSSTTEESETDGKSSISADLIRGHINTIILRTLYEKDKYGYEIIAEIEQKSHGQYTLKQPTLYSALKRLESQGYIKAYWKTDEVSSGGRRKYFTLTDSGKEITEKNQAEWEYSRTVIDNLISDSVSRVPTQNVQESAEHAQEQVVTPQASTTTTTDAVAQGADNTQTSQGVTQPQQTNGYESPTPASIEQEERRIKHENYIRLISTPAPQPEAKAQEDVVPNSEDYTTEKLIYNNKPATERDYKNLIGGIFNRAIKTSEARQPVYPQQEQASAAPYTQPQQPVQNINIATEKAKADGLKVNMSGTESVRVRNANGTTYNLGTTLFKCSVIVAIVLLFEFVLLLIFKDGLGTGLGYPFVIFSLALVQLAIFGVLALSEFGKNHTKPMNNTYISISVILTIIIILIICVVAFLLNVNFNSSADILCKMVIPCLTTLAIPIFTLCFYFLIK